VDPGVVVRTAGRAWRDAAIVGGAREAQESSQVKEATMKSIDRLSSAAAVFAIALFSLLGTCPGRAQALGSGLEVEEYRNLPVVIEKPSPDAYHIGLNESVVLNEVQLRLRSSGITPMWPSADNLEYLYVNIGVVGAAFYISVSLKRLVTYSVGVKPHSVFAPTWSTETGGTHGYNAVFILSNLDLVLDKFLNEYVRYNQ
jgi:hypothetical protein